MGRLESISVQRMNDSTDSFHRYTENNEHSEIRGVMVASRGCEWNEETDIFWLSHNVGDAYLITFYDDGNYGTIRNLFLDDVWKVHRHNGSLWTAEVTPNQSYEWKTDVLEELPDWVEVGEAWE